MARRSGRAAQAAPAVRQSAEADEGWRRRLRRPSAADAGAAAGGVRAPTFARCSMRCWCWWRGHASGGRCAAVRDAAAAGLDQGAAPDGGQASRRLPTRWTCAPMPIWRQRRERLYLPFVQCSECHTTGWLSRVAPGSSKVSTKRDEIYNTWFARRPEAVRLYPGPTSAVCARWMAAISISARRAATCRSSARSATPARTRSSCRSFAPRARGRSTRGNVAFTWHDTTCPTCGGRDRQLLRRRAERDARLAGGRAELGQRVQRRQEADRVLRFRAGRRASRGLLRRPHVRQHGPHGACEGDRPPCDAAHTLVRLPRWPRSPDRRARLAATHGA